MFVSCKNWSINSPARFQDNCIGQTKARSVHFDPLNPGEYDLPDEHCMPLYNEFNNRLGQGSGKILFSHYSPIPDELIQHLFENRNVKKLYILQMEHYPTTEATNIVTALRERIISLSEYLSLREKEMDVIYEVRRDEYCC